MRLLILKPVLAIVLVLATLVSKAAETDVNVDVTTGGFEAADRAWAAFIQPPPAGADAQLRDSFAAFSEALANNSFAEAEIVAKKMVQQASTPASMDTLSRARALHNLAVSQQFQGSHEAAIQNYDAAIGVIAKVEDSLGAEMILPLRGKALAYLDTERPFEAFQAYDRALHISNVNFGPHSLNQLPILRSRMQVYLDHGDTKRALELLDRIALLYSRRYARDSQEMLPAVYQQAQLYGQLDMLNEERAAWRQVLNIKEKHHAETDLALIEPHIRIAENFITELRQVVYRSGTTPTAEKHLRKALWIAKNSPDSDWLVQTKCLLALADYFTLVNVGSQANRYYEEAWQLMSANPGDLSFRAATLEEPVALAQPRPDPYANFTYNPDRDEIDPAQYREGEIVISYTVNERGRTQDIRIVTADPPDFSHMERRVRNAVKEFVFRPRYEAGQVVVSPEQQYRAQYLYLQDEYRASLAKSGKLDRPAAPDPF